MSGRIGSIYTLGGVTLPSSACAAGQLAALHSCAWQRCSTLFHATAWRSGVALPSASTSPNFALIQLTHYSQRRRRHCSYYYCYYYYYASIYSPHQLLTCRIHLLAPMPMHTANGYAPDLRLHHPLLHFNRYYYVSIYSHHQA